VAHGGEVVNFVGLHFLDDPCKIHGVGEVTVVQNKLGVRYVWIFIEVIDAVGIE
jgi:hypothetical protein